MMPTWVDGHYLTIWISQENGDLFASAAARHDSDTLLPLEVIASATVTIDENQRELGRLDGFEFEVLIVQLGDTPSSYRLRGAIAVLEKIVLY
ncbi:MAG: hypothetical protein V3W41_16075 [Planctomycetota bacterium]